MANRYLVGTNGAVWVNGQQLAQVSKVEAKVTGSFEDVSTLDNYGTSPVYAGYTVEGTLTMKKIDSFILKLLGNSYKTGIMPEVTIVSRLTDKTTGKAERTAIKDVAFTEFFLANYESKGLIEEAIPFKASDYDILDTI